MESKVRTSDLISLRIYMKYGDRVPGRSFSFFSDSFLLHRALILRAKEAGLVSAMLGQSTFGFVQKNDIAYELGEYINTSRAVWVELQDSKEKLHKFCLKNADIISGRPMYSQSAECWRIENLSIHE